MAIYKVLVSGKALEGYDLNQVITDVSEKFGIDLEDVRGLFDGKTKVIKEDISESEAKELARKLKSVGAQVAVREKKAAKPAVSLELVDDDAKGLDAKTQELDSASMKCPKCGVVQNHADCCESCGIYIEKYLELQTAREEQAEGSEERSRYRGKGQEHSSKGNGIPFLAIGAGIAGAVLWAIIAYSAGYEFGLLAWVIGGAVGVAYTITSPAGGNTAGVLAALITALAIVGGKYTSIQMFISDGISLGSEIREEIVLELQDEELMQSYVADNIAEEYELRGQLVDWPDWSGPDIAYEEEDYPEAIWREASARWNSMSSSEQDDFRDEIIREMEVGFEQFGGEIALYSLRDSFGWLDLLFFFFGMATAYRVAEKGKE